jgi:hypothetical protein
MNEKEFLVLIRNKIDLLIPKISVSTSLVEISTMITGRLMDLERQQSSTVQAKSKL